MEGVVNETGGTGGRARLRDVRVAGKTGTVQVVGQLEPGVEGPEDHSWFVGFAPAENARIAFAVIVEHGGHGGSTAAPVARAVLEEYYREREETPSLETVAHARVDR
jgi:penicillin-binding protein 2